jgi:hypothetical protein
LKSRFNSTAYESFFEPAARIYPQAAGLGSSHKQPLYCTPARPGKITRVKDIPKKHALNALFDEAALATIARV